MMKNISIEKITMSGGTKSYLVYADTERFGKHEIMAQLPTREEAEEWLREQGIRTPEEMLEEQISKPYGKVQIGNAMYRNLRKIEAPSGKVMVFGYSKRNSWTNILPYFANAVATSRNTAKAIGRWNNYTIKFGDACTW